MNERLAKLLPIPFRKQGQQIASDGDSKVFCDMYSKEQMIEFAEEIAKECAAKAWWTEQYNIGDGVPISKQIEQHFGVEE